MSFLVAFGGVNGLVRQPRDATNFGQQRSEEDRKLEGTYNITSIIQSSLVISTSLFSNNRLFRTVNLVPVLTRKSNNGNKILWKRGETISLLFHNIFQTLYFRSQLYIHL